MILTIVPRTPVFLRPVLHLVTTLLCFLAMGEERRATQRNLRVVTGRGGAALLLLAFRLFYNFSKFMVGYIDLPPNGRGLDERRVRGRAEAGGVIAGAIARGRGLIVMGTHVGHWDVALVELTQFGRPVTVVMRREEEEAARFAAAARGAAGIRVAHAGEGGFLMFDLLAALRRNEIVALHGDRAFGGRTARVSLFGVPTHVPAGPWDLARLSGAPILPAVVVFEGHRRLRHVLGSPIDPEAARGSVSGEGDGAGEGSGAGERPGAGGGSGAEEESGCRDGPQRIADQMETLIRRFPTQWFNFYDYWGKDEPRGPAGRDSDMTRTDRR